MRRVGLVLDPVFERHDTGRGHPERPLRLAHLREAFAATGLSERCIRVEPVEATDAQLHRVHDPGHVLRTDRACAEGARLVDATDTVVGPESAHVARLAAGSVTALALQVARGELDAGFAAVRPPGHHAERDLAMGFCLFNSAAVAAAALRAEAGVGRVLIVDWDVHHGNGTQHIFEEDPSVFYFSCHQMPLYPGTGYARERGRGAGAGTTLNVPLARGDGDDRFLASLDVDLAGAMETFRPELVLVSAGFDAHAADPLGGLAVSTEGYVEATQILRSIAERHAGGRLVSALEGGYDIDALAASATAHVEALLSD